MTAVIMTSSLWGIQVVAASNESDVQLLSSEYRTASATADGGTILHTWNWSFNTIKANLPSIAEAGFTAIQTSPIQGNKEDLMATSKWWILYQPTNFRIGNAQLGSKDEFKSMCEEAEKYGIKVIVDVVANHTGNRGGGSDQYWPATNVDSAIKDNSAFWHEHRGVDNWNDRWQVTHLGIGLPDLNTSNKDLQSMIINFLNDASACGADGFRFDAAKHIELPSDPGGSDFWPSVLGSLNNKDNLFIYGEVLQGGADNFGGYTQYMDVTASNYGHSLRSAVGFGSGKNVNSSKDYNASGVDASKLVTFVETHDTYANDSEESTAMSEWHIKMGWALTASRAYVTPLYFNRPAGSGKLSGNLGSAGNNAWKDPDITAVNNFHKAMINEGENLVVLNNDMMMIERGKSGVVIVNLGGDTYINTTTNLTDGTYINEANGGGTFNVANGRITGNLGGGKIAVLYDKVIGPTITPTSVPTPTIAPTPKPNAPSVQEGELKAFIYKPEGWKDTLNLYVYDDSVGTVKMLEAWPGVAMTNEGNNLYSYKLDTSWKSAKVIFNDGTNQTPGQGQSGLVLSTSMYYDNNNWLTCPVITPSPTLAPTPTPTVTPIPTLVPTLSPSSTPIEGQNIAYFKKPSNWGSSVNVYVYDESGSNVKEVQKWPGVAMNHEGDGLYSYTLPEGWETANVIFNEGSNQIPSANQPGFVLQGKMIYQDGSWSNYQEVETKTAYFNNTYGWNNVNIYVYDESGSSIKEVAAWPGIAMTERGNGVYSYTFSKDWSDVKVIFNNGNEQIPAPMNPGLSLTGDMIYRDNVWTNY